MNCPPALGRSLKRIIFGAAAVLLVAAALAAYSPARRATQVNPTVALRYE